MFTSSVVANPVLGNPIIGTAGYSWDNRFTRIVVDLVGTNDPARAIGVDRPRGRGGLYLGTSGQRTAPD